MKNCVDYGNSPGNLNTPVPTDEISKEKVVLYQLDDYSQMMSYVIKTSNGEIVVIDGGYDRNGLELLEFLKQITGKEKPHISAWFLTHCHRDHIMAFVELARNHADKFEVDKVYYNFPSDDFIKAHDSDAYDTLRQFKPITGILGENKLVVVQKDDRIAVDDVTFDILLTCDESVTYNAINESSIVIRMNVGEETVLFLADLGEASGFRLRKAHRENMKSDVVQMAHHGSNGVARIIYEMVSPKACLWPTPEWLWNNDQGNGFNTGPWETVELYEFMKNELGVKHHFVSKDGIQKLEFPLELD